MRIDFELNRLIDYTDEAILEEIRRVAKLLNEKPLLIERFNKKAKVSASTIIRRFGNWQNAILKADLGKSYFARAKKYSKKEIIEELRRVSEILKSKSFTREEFMDYSYLGTNIKGLRREFKTFKKAMEAAGLTLPTKSLRYTDDERFENLLDVWTYHGRQPYYSEMKKKPSRVGPKAYITRWGTWRKALLAFLERVNKDLSDYSKEESAVKTEREQQINKKIRVSQSDRKEIRLGLRYEILKRDSFKCVLCGDSPALNHGCKLEVDHIIPWTRGGLTVRENLRALCDKCNRGKGIKK